MKQLPHPMNHDPSEKSRFMIPPTHLTRRNFIAATALATGSLAFRWNPAASAESSIPAMDPLSAGSFGISDAALKNATERARLLVDQMTLDEKLGQLDNGTAEISRLGIPRYGYWREALHGVCDSGFTSFPVPLALAATWNPPLALRIYTAVSDEARGAENRRASGLSFYSPVTLNLHRDPRWGRCQEAPGEDPCLAATMAVQMIRGMQGDDPNYLKTTATAKHYICNNTDDDRSAVSAEVPARMFWEYYSRAYRAAIREGGVFTVMGSYNALNGVPCCANHFLLTDLIRTRWGFRGYVTSDCGAVNNIHDPHYFAASDVIACAMAMRAGCDLDCGDVYARHLKAAIDQELICEADIDVALVRLFTARHLLGFFDAPEKVPYSRIPHSVVNSEPHGALALEAARQSMVLLKNENGFLPLEKKSVKKVAVIGPMAGVCNLGGYSGVATHMVAPYRGIAAALGAAAIRRPSMPAEEMTGFNNLQLESGDGADHLAFIYDGSWAAFPTSDFTGKTQFQARVSSETEGGHIEVRLDSLDGPVACTLDVANTGGWGNWTTISAPLTGVSGEHKVWLRFRGGSDFLLNLESWQLNPASVAFSSSDAPQVILEPGCGVNTPHDENAFQAAVDAARAADVAILVCGVDEEIDSEGHDRDDIRLTGVQPELIKAVYAANPKTVLVLSTNNSLAVTWEQENLPAIIAAVFAGQAQGTALAEVLFGDYNPGGKLPCTWYRSIDQLPDFHDYDLTKGRTYQYFEGTPLYPFGYGLSYTSFEFSGLRLSSTELGSGEAVSISATVTNTGKRAGAEVAQLYVTAPSSSVKRPRIQLAGFQRLELHPGESKTVTFSLPYEQQPFWHWKEDAERFVVEPGTARIQIGNSSAAILLSADLTLKPETGSLPQPDAVTTLAVASRIA